MKRFSGSCLAVLFALLAACAPVDQTPEPVTIGKTENIRLTEPVDYILVDKSDRALTVFRNGKQLKVYSGIGLGDAPAGHKQFEGDERTPEGLYFIDTRNPQSSYHLSLRISYPNVHDRAFAESTGRDPGGDIFIHGQPNSLPFGRLPGDWTDGCIAVSNAEIEELWRIVPDGTPIEIRP